MATVTTVEEVDTSVKSTNTSSPLRNRSNASLSTSSPQSKLLSFHKRVQNDSYTQLSIDLVQMEVFHGALAVIQPMNCEVIVDHQKCIFASQGVKFTVSEKGVIIPFHKKINIVSDEDTNEMTIVLKLSYNTGDLIGVYISPLKPLIENRGLQDLPIVSKDSRSIGQLKVTLTQTTEVIILMVLYHPVILWHPPCRHSLKIVHQKQVVSNLLHRYLHHTRYPLCRFHSLELMRFERNRCT
jgi:hypothetical protein